MDTEFARKYLDGEVSINDDSQTSAKADDTTPSNTDTPSGEDVNSSEHHKPDEGGSGASSEKSTDTNQTDDGGIATQQTEDKKGSEDKPGFLEGKKDKKLPYPNAKDTDIEKMKAKVEEQKKNYDEIMACRQQLTAILKTVENNTQKRLDAILPQLRSMSKSGKQK